MTIPYLDFEQKIVDLMRNTSYTSTLGSVQNQRLVFGGVRGSGGGGGGPIMPFIGKLRQTDICFDTDEFATLTIPSGESASLLDNLNRIRYDIDNIVASGGGGHVIQDEGVDETQRTNLNFVGTSVTVSDDAINDATVVTITDSVGHVIQDEGVAETQRANLNFVGTGVSVADDAVNNATVVTIVAGSGTGSGGYPFDTLTVDGVDAEADYSSLVDALNAAGAGNTIQMGPGSYTPPNPGVDSLPPQDSSIEGIGLETIVTDTGVNDPDGAFLLNATGITIRDLSIVVSATQGGTAIAHFVSAASLDGLSVERVSASVDKTGAGAITTWGAYFQKSGDTITFKDCDISSTDTGGGGTAYGVEIKSGVTLHIYGGKISGATTAINNAGTVYFHNLPTISGGLTGAGTYYGWYLDSSGMPNPAHNLTNVYSAFNDSLPSVRNGMFNSNTFLEDSGDDQLGFTSDTAVGDTYTPTGHFSKSNTGTVYFYTTRHCLVINSLGGGPAILKWTDTTAKNYLEAIGQMPMTRSGTTYGGEFRFWAVQAPGAADNYWAVRFLVDAATYPSWPYRVQLFSGTGVTFAIGDGTMQVDFPWDALRPVKLQVRLQATTRCTVSCTGPQGLSSFSMLDKGSVAGMPESFKTAWLYVPGTYEAAAIDSIRIY
jgi:hypothetical protein